MRQIFQFAVLALIFSSCQRESSSDVNQKRIFAQYELFYNANEGITYARAWFRVGHATGTLLELDAPSVVTFGGDKLAFKGDLAYYEQQYPGVIASGTFHWEDTDGNFYDNIATVRPIGFKFLPDTVARNMAFSMLYIGGQIGSQESVGVWINGENEGNAQAQVTIVTGATSIIMPADQMAKISAGPGKVYLQRHFFPVLMQATEAGGSVHGVYRPRFVEVVFK